MEHSDDQNVQLSSCLLYEQYSRWKVKSKSKANLSSSTRDRHVCELVLIKDNTISQSMGMKMQNPTKSSCTGSKTKSGKGTFWCMKKSPYIGYCPEIHVFIHTWWTQMKIIMNTTTFWCSSWEHSNILMFIRDQNVCPEFQVKSLWDPGHMA